MSAKTDGWEGKVPPGPLDQLPFDDDEPLLPGGPTDDVDAPPGETADTEVLASYPVPEAAPEPVKKTRKPRAKKADKGEPVATEVLTGEVMPPEIEAEERALVRIQSAQADHHIVTGMAALARMSNEDYETAIASVVRGMERVRDFQERAMVAGEDYGKVKGIDRPFLHLPGAEKLTLLYGLAAEQKAERIVGERVKFVSADGAEIVTEQWQSPPLAYHVRTYVHVGSFDGPIVAMGYGEASSWETKYRYVQERPKCPQCGHDLRRGPKEGTGKMVGKWFCPGFAGPGGGGCWWSVAITATNPDGSLIVPTPGKVENPDPWSLAETLIQMAAKRSFVAATRRATGTSGLFTQDEDSPSVERQSDDAGPDEAPPEVEAVANAAPVERGAKVTAPTQVQINRLSQLSREKDLGPVNLAIYFNRVTGIPVNFANVPDDRAAQSTILLAAIQTATADQIGALINLLETGELPVDPADAARAPDKATN